jgi:dihydrofolate reductase
MTQPLKFKTKFIAFAAISVDGKISLKAKTPPNWTSPEDWNFLQKSLTKIDAVVVGRNTYQAAARRLRKRNTFVLSTQIKKIQRRGSVTFINPAHMNLRSILSAYKTVAILGGGAVYRFMLEHNWLDEIYITVEPLIFGRGKDMVTGGTKTIKLQLISVKKLNTQGTLLMHYLVKQ